jgi:hypothetical protein
MLPRVCFLDILMVPRADHQHLPSSDHIESVDRQIRCSPIMHVQFPLHYLLFARSFERVGTPRHIPVPAHPLESHAIPPRFPASLQGRARSLRKSKGESLTSCTDKLLFYREDRFSSQDAYSTPSYMDHLSRCIHLFLSDVHAASARLSARYVIYDVD